MSKPEAIRVPSDSCEVTVNGQTYRPHEGETVEVITGFSIKHIAAMKRMREAGVRLAVLEGEANEDLAAIAIVDEAYDELLDCLSGRVKGWDWTDDLGRPLPKPDGTTGPLARLRVQEVNWLLTAVEGETQDARKSEAVESR